jgi:hypothetical protein
MPADVARELAVLRAELAPLDDGAPAVAAMARLATLAQELAAPASFDAAMLPARDDRLLLEGLRAFAARAPDVTDDARQCWFGVSAEDGLPWMYCATAAVARAALAVLERLAHPRDQGTT